MQKLLLELLGPPANLLVIRQTRTTPVALGPHAISRQDYWKKMWAEEAS
jgi:hypothetical protein